MTSSPLDEILANVTVPFLVLGFTAVLYTVIELQRYKEDAKSDWKRKTGKGVENTVKQDHRMKVNHNPGLNQDDHEEIGGLLIDELNNKRLRILFIDSKIKKGKKLIRRGVVSGMAASGFFLTNLILSNSDAKLFAHSMETSFSFGILFGIGMVIYVHHVWGIDVWKRGVTLGNT